MLPLVVSGIALMAWAPPPIAAEQIEVERRLDLTALLALPPATGSSGDMRIEAVAHDGTHLWVLSPNGDALLRIDTQQPSLVSRLPLPAAYRVRRSAGLAFGAGSLWLVDAAGPHLLRIHPGGPILGVTALPPPATQPFGVDFRPGGASGAGWVVVAFHGEAGDALLPYEVRGAQLIPAPAEPLAVRRSAGLATALIDGSPYTWVIAERGDEERLEGDAPDPTRLQDIENVRVRPPDDTIPRGGEDVGSSHRLVLTHTRSRQVMFTVNPTGPTPRDLAAIGQTLYYPAGRAGLIVARMVEDFGIEYGRCVWRDVEFHHGKTFATTKDPEFHYAYPFEGREPRASWIDNTAGYLEHQRNISLREQDPVSLFYTLHIPNGIDRQGRTFDLDPVAVDRDPVRVETFYRVRVELCSATHNVLRDRVGTLDDIPADIRDLYTFDGDGDGFGDDDPDTDIDDFFKLDRAVVYRHLLAALGVPEGEVRNMSLYDRARKIHDYVKRRHVYSGADGGWADPERKLLSAYASCSPSAFMVVALAREAGLPARLVGTTKQRQTADGSYDLRRISDVARDEGFHRWAQVYLPPYGWVRVDATPADPAAVGFTDVNCNGSYDDADLCTDPTLCGTCPPFVPLVGPGPHPPACACSLRPDYRNPNDANEDGAVDGDDIDILGEAYYTEEVLSGSFAIGVGRKDLITIVAAGLPDARLNLHYITQLVTDGSFAGRCAAGEDCYVDWRNPKGIPDVNLEVFSSSVSWRVEGPLGPDDLVRIDAYRLIPGSAVPRYRHVLQLARNVPALSGRHPVDLSQVPPGRDYVIGITSQGGPSTDRLSALPQADWETFGVSGKFSVP